MVLVTDAATLLWCFGDISWSFKVALDILDIPFHLTVPVRGEEEAAWYLNFALVSSCTL